MRLGPVAVAVALSGVLTGALAGCGVSPTVSRDEAGAGSQIAQAVSAGLPSPGTTVLGSVPHPAEVRTEGLEVYDGVVYESARLPGRAELRELDPSTGQLIRAAELPRGLAAGGVTVVGSLVWQLARPDEIALQWNRETLNAGGRVPWTPHARGLCHDENSLFGSDGTNLLRVVDRDTGVRTDKVLDVRLRGVPLAGLSELECVPGRVLATVAGTTWIVSIDSRTGVVLSASDLAGVVPVDARPGRAASLTGIARITGTDTFLITGELWPGMVRVRFGR